MIYIVQESITNIQADAIVNAANEGLWEGGGVCGYIFKAAGSKELTKACQAIGHCDTGDAVITPGFQSKAKYIIHAVGPVYRDGKQNEDTLLYNAYKHSLQLVKENEIHSIAFPLISAGIFGYPLYGAWRKALRACLNWQKANPEYPLDIYFTILDPKILKMGKDMLEELKKEYD